MPGMVLGTGNTAVNKTDNSPTFISSIKQITNSYICVSQMIGAVEKNIVGKKE